MLKTNSDIVATNDAVAVVAGDAGFGIKSDNSIHHFFSDSSRAALASAPLKHSGSDRGGLPRGIGQITVVEEKHQGFQNGGRYDKWFWC